MVKSAVLRLLRGNANIITEIIITLYTYRNAEVNRKTKPLGKYYSTS